MVRFTCWIDNRERNKKTAEHLAVFYARLSLAKFGRNDGKIHGGKPDECINDLG